MRTRSLVMSTLLLVAALGVGCGKGFQTDYGKPAAQFLEAKVASQGRAFVGEKITVKGTVTKVDVSDPRSAWVHLTGGIKCHFGKLKAMAERCKTGDIVYVDGILERCETGDVLIDPAILRDPSAPFSPKE